MTTKKSQKNSPTKNYAEQRTTSKKSIKNGDVKRTSFFEDLTEK